MAHYINRNLLIITIALAVAGVILSLFAKWMPLFPGDLHLALWFQSFNNGLFTAVMVWSSTLFTSFPAALLVIAAGIIVGW